MGITISGPSTQIPTNVVEVGNEITQNQLNAITASTTPSTGNPMQTLSAMTTYVQNNAVNPLNGKVIKPDQSGQWNHPFPMSGNFVVVYKADTNSWWPWTTNGTVIGSQNGGTFQASYNFDFNDWYGNTVYLNGNPDIGTNVTNYTALGNWDANTQSTYSTSSGQTYYPANGPSNGQGWGGYVGSSQSFYDGSNYVYRYVYLDGTGGFYTADNQNNPPF